MTGAACLKPEWLDIQGGALIRLALMPSVSENAARDLHWAATGMPTQWALGSTVVSGRSCVDSSWKSHSNGNEQVTMASSDLREGVMGSIL